MKVECQVCGRMIGKGPEGLGIRVHAETHKREFAERTGRRPDDYAEVRGLLDDRESEQARFRRFDGVAADGGTPE